MMVKVLIYGCDSQHWPLSPLVAEAVEHTGFTPPVLYFQQEKCFYKNSVE
jgi:hypothetical protein